MKKKNLLLVVLIIACLAVFYGYKSMERMRTDMEAPEIIMDAALPELSVQDPRSALLQGVEAWDDKDGDVTASLVVESVSLLDSTGRLEVGYAAFDKAGNVRKEKREAQYTDYIAPRFTMKAPLVYTYGSNFDVLSTVGAMDVIDGEIQHRVRATSLGQESIAELGTHDVKFQVSNSLGDTVSLVLPVEIYDPGMYDAKLALSKYLVYLDKGSSFVAADYLKTFTLGGEETDLQGRLPADYVLKTEGMVLSNTAGVYPVEYRLTYTQKHDTDPSRDRRYTAYSKLIVVVEG